MWIKRGNSVFEIILGNDQCRVRKKERMGTGAGVLLEADGAVYYKVGKLNYSFELIERKVGLNI